MHLNEQNLKREIRDEVNLIYCDMENKTKGQMVDTIFNFLQVANPIPKYIKSPINYIGNKYKLISQIEPLFPRKINKFIDVFGGSGTVLINTQAEHYIYNDINYYVANIFNGIISQSAEDTISQVEDIIKEYDLSKTNKSGFEKLRDDYNNGRNDWVTLYTLMCHSFNWQMRFNNHHQYNSSWGKDRSSFTNRQKDGLIAMKNKISTDITVMSKSFEDIDFSDFDENDLVYLDPPYENTTGFKDKFNHSDYWEWVRKVSIDNFVLCSEYQAPDDFIEIWSGDVKITLDNASRSKSTEKLFTYKNGKYAEYIKVN